MLSGICFIARFSLPHVIGRGRASVEFRNVGQFLGVSAPTDMQRALIRFDFVAWLIGKARGRIPLLSAGTRSDRPDWIVHGRSSSTRLPAWQRRLTATWPRESPKKSAS